MKKFLKALGVIGVVFKTTWKVLKIAFIVLIAGGILSLVTNMKKEEKKPSSSYGEGSSYAYAEEPCVTFVPLPTAQPDEAEEEPAGSSSIPENAEEAYVGAVVDGDTLKVCYKGKDVKVRLIGVDTPESVAWQEYLERTGKKNTEEGDQAKAFMKTLVSVGTPIYIEFDVETKDIYDRYLVYAYLPDGRMIQDILLEEGLARTMTIPPNVKFSDHFHELEVEAQKARKGFWDGEFWS